MKRILTLGIPNPLMRVCVWLGGCAAVSAAGALLGPVGLAALAAVLTLALMGRLTA